MTQKFAQDGTVVAVTVVDVPECTVLQLKNEQKDGYSAVQLACGKRKNIGKSRKGHFKGLGEFRFVKEFRVAHDDLANFEVGKILTASIMEVGERIDVTGTSKGKGFQGVVRRHGFSGSPKSHGHKDQLRMPGSLGDGGSQHVKKGKRMGGHMGDAQVTLRKLEIFGVDAQKGQIFIKGAVPGARHSLLLIKTV